MKHQKSTLRSLFDAARRVFFPTPEEKAEQVRKARIQSHWSNLRDALNGIKTLEDGEIDEMNPALFLSGYGVVHAPLERAALDTEEQSMRIDDYTKKLLAEGVSEEEIDAFVEDHHDRIANPKKGLEHHMP